MIISATACYPRKIKLPKELERVRKEVEPGESLTGEDARQKRYSLETKASFISYMLRREGEEVKSNLSWYAEYIGISRTWLYKLLEEFKEKFAQEKPGPKAKDEKEQLCEKLQKELRKRNEEFTALKEILADQAKELAGHQERIVRTILQAAVCPISAREIRDLIGEAFGVRISKTKIKMLIAHYSMKARQIMQQMGPEKLVQFLGVDEIFCGHKPVLIGVDLKSFAVVICEKADSRDHDVWHQALSLFPSLKLVSSDQATGIIKAVYLCGEGVRHQFDLFHFKREVNRLLRRLESKAYKKIEAEYKAQAKMEKSKTDAQREDRQQEYLKRRKEASKTIDIFDQAEKAIKRIFDGLDIFERDGALKEPRRNLKNLQRGVAMLEKLQKTGDDKKIRLLVNQASDPRLLLYLTTLRDRLLSIILRWKKEGQPVPRTKVIMVLGRYWYKNTEKKIRLSYRSYQDKSQWKEKKMQLLMKEQRARLANLLQIRQLQLSLANFQEVFQAVNSALDQVFRASSLVESFNSQVRVCQQVKKQLHNDFIALVALKWNLSPFEEGKRKGKSPFQILGIQDKSSDWLDVLINN